VSARLDAALAHGPIILDAAMGTRLIAAGLNLTSDDASLWNLTNPDMVATVHRRDVAAGSTAVLTNTFGADRAWLARFHFEDKVAPINQAGAALARTAAGQNRLVIGSIGPTAASEPGAYREQADALEDSGVDGLLLETHQVSSAERALAEIAGTRMVPLLVSLVAWPDQPADTVRRLADLGAAVVGVNCVPGMEAAVATARALRAVTSLPILVKPNAGNPGEPFHDAASFARFVPSLLELGPILVGGCCGTDDTHVAALRAACYHDRSVDRDVSARPAEDRSP
jgi:methionine synthase I (cobalamin-dependent)